MHRSKKWEQEQLLQVKGACLDMLKLQQLDEGSHNQISTGHSQPNKGQLSRERSYSHFCVCRKAESWYVLWYP